MRTCQTSLLQASASKGAIVVMSLPFDPNVAFVSLSPMLTFPVFEKNCSLECRKWYFNEYNVMQEE